MTTKSQLFSSLKQLAFELNQEAVKVCESDSENTDLSFVKELNSKVTDTIAVLNYLTKIDESKITVNGDALIKDQIEFEDTPEETVPEEIEEKSLEEQAQEELTLMEEPHSSQSDSLESTSGENDVIDNGAQNSIIERTPAAENALADKFMNDGIKDLSEAIGISVKFMLIQELFDGDSEQYSQALNHLNSCKNNNEVAEIINKFKEKFSWDDESTAFQELNNLILRKYPV